MNRTRSSPGHPGQMRAGFSSQLRLGSPLPVQEVDQWRLFRRIPAQVLEKVAIGRLFHQSEMTGALSLHQGAMSLGKGQS